MKTNTTIITTDEGTPINFYAENAVVVTPDDVVDIVNKPVRLFVGVAGDIKVNMAGSGGAILFKNVSSGTVLPVFVNRVFSTGTTATDMVALY